MYTSTDLVEPLALDEAYLDVTENKLHQTSATLMARQIKQQIQQQTGLTASAGVSFNKFLAKLASDFQKPDGLTVVTPQHASQFLDATSMLGADHFSERSLPDRRRQHTLCPGQRIVFVSYNREWFAGDAT